MKIIKRSCNITTHKKNQHILKFILSISLFYIIFCNISTSHAKNNISNYIKCYFNNYLAGLSSKMENPKAQANGIDKALYNFIDCASSSIDCMIHELNDEKLANKLVNKHKNGISVRIIFDGDYLKSDRNNSSYNIIIKSGISYTSNNKQHNKLIIVDNNKIITGSMNFKKRGMYKNSNHKIIINNKSIDK